MSRGILDLLGLAATAAFAVPVAAYGLVKLTGPEPLLGIGLLVVAGLMFAVEAAVTTRHDVPGRVLERAASRMFPGGDDEE